MADGGFVGRGGRGAALLAALKAEKSEKAQGLNQGKPNLPTSQTPIEGTEPVRAIGRGAQIQSILSGRGRAALPVTVTIAPQVLGRESTLSQSAVSIGRGAALGLGRARSLIPSSSSSSSASPVSTSATPSPPITEMEECSIGQYSGSSGTKIDIEVNYIPLKISQGRGVYEYHVSFEPMVDSKNMKFKLINQDSVRAVIGKIRTFDSAKLYLPIQLDRKVSIPCKLPTDGSDVLVHIKFVGVAKPCDLLHLYNLLFRRILSVLKMVQIGRNYFKPHGGIPVPQHRLEIWPGYVTAVQEFEGGVMLYADASFRVLRSVSAKDVMSEILARQTQEDAARAIVGSIVLTRYNNNTYKIDDVAWDVTPKSTFTCSDGKVISFVDYYKRAYDLVIKDLEQPMLLSKSKKKSPEEKGQNLCLVPELCFMTGLTDAMRSDFKIMRDIATHTRVAPGQRQLCFKTFIDDINKTPEAKQLLADWNLNLDCSSLELSGRLLDREKIILKSNTFEVSPEADWGRQITNNVVFVAVNLDNWFIVYTKRDAAKVTEFINMLKKVSPSMGIRVNNPDLLEIPNDRTDTYCGKIRSNINTDVQLAVVVFPNPRDDRYSAVKKVCCLEMPIPSQCLNVRTISQFPKLRSVTQKIALQINCKLGGELWAVPIPLKEVMVCGLDTYHDAAQRNKSILGFVASINGNLTRWFSKTATQKAGQELGDALQMLFISAIRKYHNINHSLPQKIFLYRDGVGDGMLDHVGKYEVDQLVSCFERIQPGYCPSLTVIVVQKRINTRIYQKKGRGLENPRPGTVLDHTVTRKRLYDFFLVSQHVGQGTVSPTHFVVVHDSSKLKPEHLQRLTYKMTHMYYNWPGTVRVPAPCQYAHKLAYLVGQNLHKEAHETLADKLFFL